MSEYNMSLTLRPIALAAMALVARTLAAAAIAKRLVVFISPLVISRRLP